MASDDHQALSEVISVDWTVDPSTNRSNSSPEFLRLGEEVGRILRDSARDLIAGRTDRVGHLVMAQLAHKQGLAPAKVDVQDITNEDGALKGSFVWNGILFSFTAQPIASGV